MNRLQTEIATALARPEVKDRLFAIGMEVVANTPQQFAAHIKAEIAKWGKLIKDANIHEE